MTLRVVAIALIAGVAGCTRSQPDAVATKSGGALGAVAAPAQPRAKGDFATEPESDCDWIPSADVEAVVGKLAEPPHEGEGGCVYTLPIPQSVLDDRAKWHQFAVDMAKRPGSDTSLLNRGRRYDIYGFVVEVHLKDEGLLDNVGKSIRSILADAAGGQDTARAAAIDSVRRLRGGWDAPGMSYGGRIGHIRVSVTPIASDFDLPGGKLDTLAVRVRDRIPDRPFVFRGYSPEEDNDPCAFLTRQEAEAVLGPLVLAPYRTANDGPLAFATGPSCGYYTAGHHVLIVTPHWKNGQRVFALNKGLGGLVASMAKDNAVQSADTLEGPWDEAAMSPDTRLLLRKGDRLLEVQYRESSVGVPAAVKLGRLALPRLAAAKVAP